jgi:hypothetical protein
MIDYLARTFIALVFYVALTIARHSLTGRPLPTAGEWVMIVIIIAIVAYVIDVIVDAVVK